MSDFDENFFDGFDEDVDQVFLDNEDLLDDIIQDDEEEGVNRTFLIAGLGLVGVFLASIIGIVLLASGGDGGDEDASNTIVAANLTQEQVFAAAGTQTQIADDSATAVALTAEAEALETANAGQTQTIDAYETLLDQTRLANDRNQTATELAIHAAETQTATALTPPPTEPPPPTVIAISLDPADSEGLTIYVIRDDNNDGEVERPIVATPPPPTAQPTLTPQSTPTITLTPTEIVIPDDLAPADASATFDAVTQQAERDNLRATSDAAATFRAETQNAPTLEPTEVSELPDTDTDIGPDTDITEPDIGETLTQTVVSVSDRVSVQVPEGWENNDQIETLGILYIGNSIDAIETRAVVEGETPPPVVGLGGQIIPQTLADTGADTVTPELLAELLAGSLEAVPDIDVELATIEGPTDITFDNGVIAHYIILSSGNEQSILAYLGFADDVALVNLSSTVEEFDANRDLLFAILETISVPAEIGAVPIDETVPVDPVQPEETEEFDDNAQGSLIDPFDNGVMFFRVDPNSGNVGDHQDGSSPTPTPGGDTVLGPFVFGGGEQIFFELPPEPGTYYVVTDLLPGSYTLTLDGRAFTFDVPVVSAGIASFVDVELEGIGGPDQRVILRVYARIGEGGTPVPPSDLSPFLQTATAVAGGRPGPTVTETTETLPTAGSSGLDSGGLTLLAILGVGLIGVVFVVRRLRAESYT